MSRGSAGLAVTAFALLAVVTLLPTLIVRARTPPGREFVGSIFYPDDFLQYMSFAEQAARGRVVFVNKFDPTPHVPALVNVEWWAAGVTGALLGGRLGAGFQAVRLAALLALAAGVVSALRRADLRGPRLVVGTVFVLTAGGLGWLRLWQGVALWQVPDLIMGLYAWHQALSNPHFLVGTALLLWTVLLHLDWREGHGAKWRWIALAWVLGLSRPYDLVVFVGLASGIALWDAARQRSWAPFGRLLALAWLAPVLAYFALLAGLHPSFAGWGTQAGDLSPPRLEFLYALGPPAVLILAFHRRSSTAPPLILRTLGVWCACLSAILLLWTAPMAKQCLVSFGTALLLWATSVTPVRVLGAALVALFPTSALLFWLAIHPAPLVYVPADYGVATQALRSACSPGDVAIAPTDLSLLVAGRTPCHVVVGHRLLTPGFAQAAELGRRFYEPSTSPEWRLEYLRGQRAAFVLLPAGQGAWLGSDPPFARVLSRPVLELWARQPGI